MQHQRENALVILKIGCANLLWYIDGTQKTIHSNTHFLSCKNKLKCVGLFKGLPTTSEDLSVFVVFLIFLFYFSLQQTFSNGFSVISHPILMKFGMLIVLDGTKSLNIISSQ